MTISEIFENLKSLQDILVEKYDLEEKVQNAPKQLKGQEDALARYRKEFITTNTEYDEVKQVVLSLKADLEKAVKLREDGEKGMDNITTHREYEALEKQINDATAKENELRTELQAKEKRLAELNEDINSQTKLIESQESDLATSRESLDKEISTYTTKLAILKQKEDAITPNLDKEILFKFERIIQRNSEGIVTVKNGVCSGCHMILPAQFANVVRAGDSINFCPYCSRILYYKEVDASEQDEASFNFNVAGSLAGLDDDDDDDDYDSYDGDEENEKSYDEYSDDYEGEDEDEEDLDESDDDSDED